MNRNTILECMYEVIRESIEWGFDSEDKKYSQFVDGVMTMTDAMLEREKEMHKKMIEGLRSSGVIGVESSVEFSE